MAYNNNNNDNNEKKQSLGALWIKNKGNKDYMTGNIKFKYDKSKVDKDGNIAIQLVAFMNNFKKEAKHPDWIINESVPQNNYQNNQEPKSYNNNGNSNNKKSKKNNDNDDIKDDDYDEVDPF